MTKLPLDSTHPGYFSFVDKDGLHEGILEIEILTHTHKKCPRCYRYVVEVFPYNVELPPICRRCCIIMWDVDHGVIGSDYNDPLNQT